MEIDWQDIASQLQAQNAELSMQLAIANAQIAKLTAPSVEDQEDGQDG